MALNGGSYSLWAAHNTAGSTYTARAILYAAVGSNGTYAVTYNLIGSVYSTVNGAAVPANASGTIASGTWLPSGRAASDFTVTLTATPSRAVGGTAAYVGTATNSTACLQDPNNKTAVSTASAAGSTGAELCMEAGGHAFERTDPTGGTMGGSIAGNITITIKDNRTGVSASSVFSGNVSDGY